MQDISAEKIAQRVYDLNLLDQRQLEAVWSEFGTRNISADDFRHALLKREMLTNYQLDRVLRGEKAGYFYGDYKVLYLVGTGSFARVYRAVHKTSGQVVAVKVLRSRFSDKAEDTNQFLREGEVGIHLRHPNIVPIYEVSKRKPYYLVMDFVEGRTLREFMKVRKKLDPSEATKLITDVTAGLAYAAQKGINHRDLKLSNVLVSSSGMAQLVDFGLAGLQGELSDEDLTNCPNPRTIDYAGLERATGVRKDDSRSDIYFVGCIFYNLLSGVAPLSDTKDRIKRLSLSRYQEVKPLTVYCPDIPQRVLNVVNKAMSLEVERRYQTPTDMLADLHATMKWLKSGQPDDAPAETQKPESATTASAAPAQTIMIVESSPDIQNVFRAQLKKYGYRVLVISDPERALGRFQAEPTAADCVIFSAVGLGPSAVRAFNRFGQDRQTTAVPAVLLLDKGQNDWQRKAELNGHRVAMVMPVRMKDFHATLTRLASRV